MDYTKYVDPSVTSGLVRKLERIRTITDLEENVRTPGPICDIVAEIVECLTTLKIHHGKRTQVSASEGGKGIDRRASASSFTCW